MANFLKLGNVDDLATDFVKQITTVIWEKFAIKTFLSMM